MKTKNSISTKIGAFALAAVMVAGLGSVSNAVDHTEAASKKLSVNTFYNTQTKVSGKTKGKYQLRVTVNGKTYKAKASKKGNYSVKIPKQNAGKTFYVKSYKKKGKKYKYYTKKKVYTIANKLNLKSFKTTSTSISGYTRKRYKVTIIVNNKSYKATASKVSGYFKVKLSKAIGNNSVKVAVKTTTGKSFTSSSKKPTNYSNGNNSNGNKPNKPDDTTQGSCDEVGHDIEHIDSHNIWYVYGRDIDYEYNQYLDNEVEKIMEKYLNDSDVTVLTYDDYKACYNPGSNYGPESIDHCKKCDIYFISQGASDGKEYPNGQSWWTPSFPYTIKIEGVYSKWVISKEQGAITRQSLYKKYATACKKYNRPDEWVGRGKE